MKLRFIIFVATLICIAIAFYGYRMIFGPNVSCPDTQDQIIHIPSDAQDIDIVIDTLSSRNLIRDKRSIRRVAQLMKYKKPKSGRYLVKDGWSNKQLISLLRSGRQSPLNLTFNNLRTINELVDYFAHTLELNKTDLSADISNFIATEEEYTQENIMSLFIPNTYQIYWTTSGEDLLKRFTKERRKFFNEERMQKLSVLGLTKSELYTLASIVQKETLVNDEKPRVAGVYLNRLRRGQLLQADPTVVFANGDFEIRRVLNKHLAIDSPYNTYKYSGLPPGPICMPDISSLDAVLNYEKHKYLYFCAKPDNSGRHAFARNLIEHNRNADNYRRFLNKSKIYR